MRKHKILLTTILIIICSLFNFNSIYAYKYVCTICEKSYNAATYEEAVEKHLQDHMSDDLGITCIGDLENTEMPDELFDTGDDKRNRIISILNNIDSIIFSAILALIGSLLYGISSAAYGFLGENDFMGNFIKFSLNFESMNDSVASIASNVSSLLTGLAFSLVVLFVLRNILLNYILWRGNPSENPLETIIGIAMCVAMIAGFSEIYAGISSILGNLVTSISGRSANIADIPNNLLNSVGISISDGSYDTIKTFTEDPTGLGGYAKLVVVLFLLILLFIKLLQALVAAAKAGLELLALKVAAPMFCLSLLNNNIGGFGSYLKEICKRFFGIMLRVAAINIALEILSSENESIIFTICGAFASMAVIENAGQFLSGIVSSVGGGGNEVTGAIGATSTIANISTIGIRNKLKVNMVSMLKRTRSTLDTDNNDYKEREYMRNMANEFKEKMEQEEKTGNSESQVLKLRENIQERREKMTKLDIQGLTSRHLNLNQNYLLNYVKRSSRYKKYSRHI